MPVAPRSTNGITATDARRLARSIAGGANDGCPQLTALTLALPSDEAIPLRSIGSALLTVGTAIRPFEEPLADSPGGEGYVPIYRRLDADGVERIIGFGEARWEPGTGAGELLLTAKLTCRIVAANGSSTLAVPPHDIGAEAIAEALRRNLQLGAALEAAAIAG